MVIVTLWMVYLSPPFEHSGSQLTLLQGEHSSGDVENAMGIKRYQAVP
jgi:hypothetical protein